MWDIPATALPWITAATLSGCCVSALWLIRRRGQRRRRLSALLAREGWESAPPTSTSGWQWQKALGAEVPSIVIVKPSRGTLELRVTPATPLSTAAQWLVVPAAATARLETHLKHWPKGASALLRQRAEPCPQLPGHMLFRAGGDGPSPAVLQVLQALGRGQQAQWTIYLGAEEGWAQRSGARTDRSWPEMRRLGRALVPSVS